MRRFRTGVTRVTRAPLAGMIALGLLWPCTGAQVAAADPPKPLLVKAKRKPDMAWKTYETRTLARVSGFRPGARKVPLSTYGGRLDRKVKATGFFRVEKVGDRWWLVDPEGCLFIHVGVCGVRATLSPGVRDAYGSKFGNPKAWADAATAMLRENGFNGTGAWSQTADLRAAARPVAYTLIHNFMSSFGRSKRIVYQKPGHAGYPDDCIPVFHPEFPAFCDSRARALAAVKDDPWLLGHFSDNEMPGSKSLLDRFLRLDAGEADLAPGRRAAEAWLAKRKGGKVGRSNITDADRDAWRGHVFDTYFRITTSAIRKYDPNHLCLGSRLHGSEKRSPAIFRAAGQHLDAIGVNYYGAWTPDADLLAGWTRWSGRPVLITEWYTKGQDSGMANTTGAGWIVPTQKDRGRFYQNFTLALLESKTCVGWHWFKYMDNDPKNLKTDPSNRDSNKGLVTIGFEPYADLVDMMRALNREVYPLIDHFDSQRR